MAKRIEKNWDNFLKFARSRAIQYQGKEYLVAHKNFFDQIIFDLVEKGFLKKLGTLGQVIGSEERKRMGGLSDFSGNTTTYLVLKPYKETIENF